MEDGLEVPTWRTCRDAGPSRGGDSRRKGSRGMCLTTEGRDLGADSQRPRRPKCDCEHDYEKNKKQNNQLERLRGPGQKKRRPCRAQALGLGLSRGRRGVWLRGGGSCSRARWDLRSIIIVFEETPQKSITWLCDGQLDCFHGCERHKNSAMTMT